MPSHLEANKQVVQRFNKEVIQDGRTDSARDLFADGFVNRTAPPGGDSGPNGMLTTFNTILRPALSDFRVTIHEQIAEGDLVTSRKTISGRHTGDFMGIAPTGRDVAIQVIDIVRVVDGQYKEHWGLNTLAQVLQQLRA